MLRKIDDDPLIDGLAALRRAAAAGGNDSALVPANGERLQRLVHAAGHHDPRRHDLVEGGVGGVAASVEGVEQDVTRNFTRKPRGQRAVFRPIPGFFAPFRTLHGVVFAILCRAPLPRRVSPDVLELSCLPAPGLARQSPAHSALAAPIRRGTIPPNSGIRAARKAKGLQGKTGKDAHDRAYWKAFS